MMVQTVRGYLNLLLNVHWGSLLLLRCMRTEYTGLTGNQGGFTLQTKTMDCGAQRFGQIPILLWIFILMNPKDSNQGLVSFFSSQSRNAFYRCSLYNESNNSFKTTFVVFTVMVSDAIKFNELQITEFLFKLFCIQLKPTYKRPCFFEAGEKGSHILTPL